MHHFATPEGPFSPVEAALASVLDRSTAQLDALTAFGLALIAADYRSTVVIIAMTIGFEVDKWPT